METGESHNQTVYQEGEQAYNLERYIYEAMELAERNGDMSNVINMYQGEDDEWKKDWVKKNIEDYLARKVARDPQTINPTAEAETRKIDVKILRKNNISVSEFDLMVERVVGTEAIPEFLNLLRAELVRQCRIDGLNKARAIRWANPDRHKEQGERTRRTITHEARSRGGKKGATVLWSQQSQQDRMRGNKYAVGKGRPRKKVD